MWLEQGFGGREVDGWLQRLLGELQRPGKEEGREEWREGADVHPHQPCPSGKGLPCGNHPVLCCGSLVSAPTKLQALGEQGDTVL